VTSPTEKAQRRKRLARNKKAQKRRADRIERRESRYR
jgi:hypothetical protein